MQKTEHNKAVGTYSHKGEEHPEEATETTATPTPESGGEQPYHFSGEGTYRPQTVRARTLKEAEERWQATRQKND